MKITGRWPLTERLVIGWLREHVPSATWYSELPEEWTDGVTPDRGRVGVVERTPGGGAAGYDQDALVDIALFAPTRAQVWDFAADVEPWMLTLPGRTTPAIDDVEQRSAFGFVKYSNPAVRRVIATYRVTARPH